MSKGEERELTLPKILICELVSKGGLKSAFQKARVFIVPKQEDKKAKVGIEVQLIPIKSTEEGMEVDEERFKPRSLFFNVDEIEQFDRLIEALAKARWMFFLDNKKVDDEEMIPFMVNSFMAKIRNEVESGIREWRRKNEV
ncbi:MAG: hypothetical protein QXH03_10900 [Candidatus Bathyarchaeia archaeon]